MHIHLVMLLIIILDLNLIVEKICIWIIFSFLLVGWNWRRLIVALWILNWLIIANWLASHIFKRPVVLADAKQCSLKIVYWLFRYKEIIYLPSFGFHPISVGCNAERVCLGAFRKSYISVKCSVLSVCSIASNWKSI